MYKTKYSVNVKMIAASPSGFTPADEYAEAIVNQMLAHKDLECPGSNVWMGLPYHNIDSVIVTETREESEYTDDNAKDCVIPEEATTGTLTIINSTTMEMLGQPIYIHAELNGIYSGMVFRPVDASVDKAHEGWSQSYLVLGAGDQVVLKDMPRVEVEILGHGKDKIPCTMVLT